MIKNHPSDFDSPFGKIVPLLNGSVMVSCRFCPFTRWTTAQMGKKWSAASRARMGLQLHALRTHKDIPEVAEYAR